jgi:surface carbohydrate biosynthesis protein
MAARFLQILKIICTSGISIVPPKKREVVLIFPHGYEIISVFVSPTNIVVADPERLNLYFLIRTLFSKDRSTTNYLRFFIRYVQPRAVFTFIDNYVPFYGLKHLAPEPKYIAVQNGIRNNFSTEPHQGFHESIGVQPAVSAQIDFVCVFNQSYSNLYRSLVATKCLVTGNIKNNLTEIPSDVATTYDIAYISQYPPSPLEGNTSQIYFNDVSFPIENFYTAESLAVNFLSKYCAEHNLSFVVCGKRDKNFSAEREFFENAMQYQSGSFVPRATERSTLDLAGSARIVITVDSTVGYDLFSRGKRVAFFSGRLQASNPGDNRHIKDMEFGYPNDIEPTGKFWTNEASESELVRILNYLRAVTDEEWAAEIAPYNESLMAYQPGNPVFKKLLLELGLTLIDGVKSNA